MILIPSALFSPIIPYLPSLLFISRSISADTHTNLEVRQDLCPGLILRLFFERIMVTPNLLFIQSRAKSNMTFSFSKKDFKLGFLF